MSFYDSWTRLVSGMIGTVNPRAGARFVADRAVLSHYQAATRRGPLGHKRPSRKSADEIIHKDLKEIVARSRDLARNNTRIRGALRTLVSQVVFGGFRPQVQFMRQDGNKDTERNKAIEKRWAAWCKAVGWWNIEKLTLRHNWEDGGIFLRIFPDPVLLNRGVVPLGIEALEMDHLDTSINQQLKDGGLIRRGIEFDAWGHVAAYHLYPEHPGDNTFGFIQKSVRIPAEQIVHVWEQDRASQTRGVPWLASLVMDAYELNDYEAAVRIVARLQAAFGTFIKTQNSAQYMADFSGMGLMDNDQAAGLETGIGIAQDQGEIPEVLESGSVHVLPPGLDVAAVSSTQPGPDYEAYMRANLQGMSTGVGVTYETFANDYASSTYSSARNGSLNERRNYRMQQFFLLAHAHGPIWERWCAMLAASNLEPGVGGEIPVSWLLPGWPWVDPRNDATAAKMRLEMGVTSRQRIAADAGDDFHDVAAEQKEEDEVLAGQAPGGAKEGE